MNAIPLEITRWADESNVPGWVECRLVDAEGQAHVFIEKVPVITTEDLRPDTKFPRPCAIACEVQSEWKDVAGRSLTRVDTIRPWGVESTAGQTTFVIFTWQLGSTPT